MSIEDRVFADLPWSGVMDSFTAACAMHGDRTKLIDQVQSQCGQGFERNPALWTDAPALRTAMGKAAKVGEWFKRQDRAQEWVNAIRRHWMTLRCETRIWFASSVSCVSGSTMPELPEILATHGGRGSVVAPAGFGKTHLIAAAVGMAGDRQLVLTHTYAGVNALRRKMRELKVPGDVCRVDTIASWALRLSLSYEGASGWSIERPAGGQWPGLYRACDALLDHPFIRRIIRASYMGVYVDEYQDCSAAQHQLVLKSNSHATCRAESSVIPCRPSLISRGRARLTGTRRLRVTSSPLVS